MIQARSAGGAGRSRRLWKKPETAYAGAMPAEQDSPPNVIDISDFEDPRLDDYRDIRDRDLMGEPGAGVADHRCSRPESTRAAHGAPVRGRVEH